MARTSAGAMTIGQAMVAEVRIVFALMLRQMRAKFGQTQLGYLWAILEPAALILGLSLFMEMQRGYPPVGSSYPLFLATGYLPFKAFFYVANDLRKSIGRDGSALEVPQLNQFDQTLAAFSLRAMTMIMIIITIVLMLNSIGYRVVPDDFVEVMHSYGWLCLFALGFGLVTAVITELVPVYEYFHSVFTFKLLFLSGVFNLPELMPPEIRYYLDFNPLLHVVAWFRSAFIFGYESSMLDKAYVIKITLVLLVIGLVAARIFRPRLLSGGE